MRKSISVFSHCVTVAALSAIASSAAFGDLVHYLPFDDGSAATLQDYGTVGAANPGNNTAIPTGAYENPGIVPTSTTATPPVFTGYAENYPGNLNLANSTSSFNLNTAGQAMTISLWVKQTGTDAQGLVSKLPGNQASGWGLAIAGSGPDAGKLRFSYTATGGGGNRLSTTAIASDTWTHVAMTWVSGSDDNILKFYINGVDAGINLSYIGPSLLTASTVPIHIGTIDGAYQPVIGTLDDVALFNKVLTPGEVKSLSTAPTVLGNYTADDLQKLFTLHDGASAVTTQVVDGTTWSYVTGLTGHAAGDTWKVGDTSFIQLDAAGTGVSGVAANTPEPASLAVIGGAATLLLRRRRV